MEGNIIVFPYRLKGPGPRGLLFSICFPTQSLRERMCPALRCFFESGVKSDLC